MTTKTRKTSKPATTAADYDPPAVHPAALKFAKSLVKKDYGPVTVVRATAQRFPTLKRRAVLAIAETLGFNLGTASRQFQEIRSGNVKIEEL